MNKYLTEKSALGPILLKEKEKELKAFTFVVLPPAEEHDFEQYLIQVRIKLPQVVLP